MPSFDLRCETCAHVFEVFRSFAEGPPHELPCPQCGKPAKREWTLPEVFVSNPIEGRWNTRQYEHLAFDLWPETVKERHERHTVKNRVEATDYLRKRVQTKVHPREAKRGHVQFPQVG
ncbi:MAG: hypothetical protein A2902_01615 [Elusimicrobia bacterium RIFCSPLOWO2_01_FULL_64_13]|nr:MAG: hypothetical protein A2902_01615 [Elusimicrobia bacterium RIFCSPLOWO2_01_FULL_64_13]